MRIVTCVAPVNIAVIKYWGKRDEDLILPINDSISATLSLDYMCAKTTIMASPLFKENKIWLNGKEETFDNPRIENCLKDLRHRAELCGDGEILKWNIHICSENNFPTAAGLASSAAGYACLVTTLAKLFGVPGDVSSVARRGSGSACRSVFGGWVHWHKGTLCDGSDSIATQIAPSDHWPEMRILVLVVNDARKKHSSTSAMQRSVLTSKLLKYRAEHLVGTRTTAMVDAIKNKDFETFAELTMKDSNQFHAVCLDTYPPCTYMNDVSHSIVDLVHSYNEFYGCNKLIKFKKHIQSKINIQPMTHSSKYLNYDNRSNYNTVSKSTIFQSKRDMAIQELLIAYTFDAGPNACLYLLKQDVPHVLSVINTAFPSLDSTVEYVRGSPLNEVPLIEDLKLYNIPKQNPGLLKYIIHTKVGDGPKILKDFDTHLLNEAGLPKLL